MFEEPISLLLLSLSQKVVILSTTRDNYSFCWNYLPSLSVFKKENKSFAFSYWFSRAKHTAQNHIYVQFYDDGRKRPYCGRVIRVYVMIFLNQIHHLALNRIQMQFMSYSCPKFCNHLKYFSISSKSISIFDVEGFN